MPKILIIDTYYPDFLKTVPIDPSLGYEANLRKILDRGFGTADFYSRNLRALGWDAVDVIANHEELQSVWQREDGSVWGLPNADILAAQIRRSEPDVLFFQDLSLLRGLNFHYDNMIVAGQCSCPFPEGIPPLDVVFTSFPHYVERFQANGHTRAIYNPLAFDPIVIEQAAQLKKLRRSPVTGVPKPERIHDVVFIGGVGNPSHWKYGMEVLEHVAREIPTFKWWGYGVDTLPLTSALRPKYHGEAYGLDMYEILLQSKICLNRHGEVAEGYANNMRLFEASGAGALLLTEEAPNLSDFFTKEEAVSYSNPADAVAKIRYLLDRWEYSKVIAANGQRRTLRDHTYAKRMVTVSDTLKEMLCPA